MTIRKCQAKFLFFAAILVSCVVWLLSAPSDPNRIFAAFPPEVEILSVHDDLGQRLDSALRNPVVQGLLHALLKDSSKVIPQPQENAAPVWFRRLCGQRAILAVPPREVYGRHVLLFATACGGWSQRLRWLATLGRIPAVPAAECDGVTIWEYVVTSRESGRIFFACMEGAVLGCYGPDPVPLEDAVRRYSRTRSRRMAFLRLRNRLPSPVPRPSRDRGWVRIEVTDKIQRIDWSVSLLSAEALTLRLSPVFTQRVDLAPLCASQSWSSRVPCRPAGGETWAVIRIPAPLLGWISEKFRGPFSALMAACAATSERLGSDTVDLLIVRSSQAVSDNPGGAVPVLVIPSQAHADHRAAFRDGLDVFNRMTGWNLILRPGRSPRSSEGHAASFYSIESGLEGSPYDRLPEKYHPAFLVLRCGTILAPRCAFAMPAAAASWTPSPEVAGFLPRGHSPTLLAARLDLEKLADPLRRIVSLYVLRNLVSGQPEVSRDALRLLLKTTRMCTSVLRKTGQVGLLAEVEDVARLAVTLEFGRKGL